MRQFLSRRLFVGAAMFTLLGNGVVFANGGVKTVYFVDLECVEVSDLYGHDTLQLKSPEAKLPMWSTPRIKAGEVRDLRNVRGVRFQGFALFQLWEYDNATPDDLLGSWRVRASETGLRTVTIDGDGGKYRLRYIVK